MKIKIEEKRKAEDGDENDFEDYNKEADMLGKEFEIPFNKLQLKQFMNELEESNLMLMQIIQDDERVNDEKI